jgi:hypothetical protein
MNKNKTEQPTFKIGDWIIYLGKSYSRNSIGDSGGSITIPDRGWSIVSFSEMKLWKPKPNEWCWFFNKHNMAIPKFGKFLLKTDTKQKFLV